MKEAARIGRIKSFSISGLRVGPCPLNTWARFARTLRVRSPYNYHNPLILLMFRFSIMYVMR